VKPEAVTITKTHAPQFELIDAGPWPIKQKTAALWRMIVSNSIVIAKQNRRQYSEKIVIARTNT
jgi:hypothetical protein